MAEIRLVCPGCAAEYRLSDAAIPSQGREVECSACGHVWHAAPPTQRLTLAQALPPAQEPSAPDPSRTTFPAGNAPALSRALPSSVLDILRDEVEHERRARAAETEGQDTRAAVSPAPDAPRTLADPDWPATTITRHIDPKPAEAAPAIPANPAARPATAPRRHEPAHEIRPVPAPVTGRQRYAAGFGLSIALAATCVGLYAVAPMLADHGALGEAIVDARAQADEIRLWLQNQADLLLP